MELRWRLEQHARLVVLHEHYTSQRCSNCAFRDDTYVENRSVLEAGERGECWQSEQAAKTNIFGLRWCPNCKTLWHRDVNAGRNIRQVFLEQSKPPHERRQTFKKDGALDGAPSNTNSAASPREDVRPRSSGGWAPKSVYDTAWLRTA